MTRHPVHRRAAAKINPGGLDNENGLPAVQRRLDQGNVAKPYD
jgi:hypothetical protein